MTAVKADYGFQEITGAGFAEYLVTPPPLDVTTTVGLAVMRGFLAFMLGLFGSIAIVVIVGGSALTFLFTLLGITAGVWIASKRKMRKAVAESIRTHRIRVTAEGLSLNGVLYQRRDIRGLWVQDPHAGRSWETSSITVVSGTGIGAVAASAQAGAQQAGAMVGQMFAAHVNKRGYALQMRYGARDVLLVGAIEQGVAEELCSKMTQALQATA